MSQWAAVRRIDQDCVHGEHSDADQSGGYQPTRRSRVASLFKNYTSDDVPQQTRQAEGFRDEAEKAFGEQHDWSEGSGLSMLIPSSAKGRAIER